MPRVNVDALPRIFVPGNEELLPVQQVGGPLPEQSQLVWRSPKAGDAYRLYFEQYH